jgi:hypothetical protein
MPGKPKYSNGKQIQIYIAPPSALMKIAKQIFDVKNKCNFKCKYQANLGEFSKSFPA